MRGIHTEKLMVGIYFIFLNLGNFMILENLDISFNIVENQHNLICARNFKCLKTLAVTGNPFAIAK